VAIPKPIIRLVNIEMAYQMAGEDFLALEGIDLTIHGNDYVAITGPSGSGKSTLMNILGCLATPSAGQYFLAGVDVAGLDEGELARVRNRSIGFVFQSFNLLPRLTAVQNVMLPLRFRFTPTKIRRELANQALETVGLGHRVHHLPNQLSGGQRQRVAIARALVTQPEVLLADEPTGNLDSRTTEEVMGLFDSLHDQGQTIVVVTHEKEISDRCRRQLVLVDGRIRSDSRGGAGHRVQRVEARGLCSV